MAAKVFLFNGELRERERAKASIEANKGQQENSSFNVGTDNFFSIFIGIIFQ